MTPLHFACKNGYFEIVHLLLSQPGIDINCKTIQIQYFILFKSNISSYSNPIFYYIQIQYFIIFKSNISFYSNPIFSEIQTQYFMKF